MSKKRTQMMSWETGANPRNPGKAKLRFLAGNKRVVFAAVFDRDTWRQIDAQMREQISRYERPMQ